MFRSRDPGSLGPKRGDTGVPRGWRRIFGTGGPDEATSLGRPTYRPPDASPLTGKVLLLDPGSGGPHVVPSAPGLRPTSGHVAVEEVRYDPHGREPEGPRPEPPRAAEPPRDAQERRPLGDPQGYRLGPPGEHHTQFPANPLPKVHLSPSFLVHCPPRSPIIQLAASREARRGFSDLRAT